MTTRLSMLGAAALALAASGSLASPLATRSLYDHGPGEARILVRGPALDLKGRTVSISGVVAPDGRLRQMAIVRSSGSYATDQAVEAVLRTLVVSAPPLRLTDGEVLMNVQTAPLQQAATR